MDISKTIIYHLLLFLVFVSICQSCGRGSIKIQNNGYKDILIAINERVPEDITLLDKIKQAFVEASSRLYIATRNRSYFEEITILVPSTWQNQSTLYDAAGNESYDKSDIVVDLPSSPFVMIEKPFTIKSSPCGQPGHSIHFTPDFFLQKSAIDIYGPLDKVIVHEWAHYRYGVFDEYPTRSQPYYPDTGGVMEATRCSKHIKGKLINTVTGQPCRYTENSQSKEDCIFVENETEESGVASLMYKTFLPQVSLFCDNESGQKGSSKTRHNSNAPTQQNRLCDGRSVWEVLNQHPDFANGANPPRLVTDTTPKFNLKQPKNLRTVLVLDISGSMDDDDKLLILRKGCVNYIANTIRNGEYLGIVWFNKGASIAKPLTLIDGNSARLALQESLPTKADGGTSIGGGVLKAVQMLNYGGSIIVVTDGLENAPPLLVDITEQVQDARVTIHSIAITNAADSKLDLLATSTGGLSFIYSGNVQSNAISEAFHKIGEFSSVVISERSYVVRSETRTISSNSVFQQSVSIDKSLGRLLEFTFDYTGRAVVPKVTSPSDVEYSASDTTVVEHDTTFGIFYFRITSFEVGKWHYSVTSTDTQRVAVTVSAQSAEPDKYPIIVTVHWGKSTLESIGPSQQNPTQELYASVSQGFNPVLKAHVTALVDRPDGSIISISLQDDGTGADAFPDDGIYSAYLKQFVGKGRYGINVIVEDGEATVISPTRIIGRPVASRYDSNEADETFVQVSNMSRNEIGESFQLLNFFGDEGDKLYNPGKINDLQVVFVSYEQQMVSLTWTAVGDQLDEGQASGYDIRFATDFELIRHNFSDQMQVTKDMLTTSGNLSQPRMAGEQEWYNISVPSKGSVTYVFAVKALDTDGRNATGPISNIVSASLENFDTPKEGSKTYGFNKTVLIILATCGSVMVLTVAIAVIVVLIRRKSFTTKSE